MNRLYLYYPLVLLVGLLGLDRLTSLPSVEILGRRKPGEVENVRAFVPGVLRQLDTQVQAAGPGTRGVLFIGSSRSFAFASFEPKRWNQDPRLDAGQRRFLDGFRGTGRLSLPMQDAITMLAVGDALAEATARRGRKLDVIVLEASPFIPYSTLLAETRWYKNYYPADFIRRHLSVLPSSLRGDALARLVFASYRTKFEPDLALRNFLSGNEQPTAEQVAALYALQSLERMQFLLKRSFPGENPSPEERAHLLQTAQGSFSSIYKATDPDLTLRPVFLRMLETYRAAAQHVVLWLPPVHRSFVDMVYRRVDRDGQLFPRYYELMRASGLPYYNGYEILDDCDYWADAGHLSVECYPLAAYRILQCASPTAGKAQAAACEVGADPLDPLNRAQVYFDEPPSAPRAP